MTQSAPTHKAGGLSASSSQSATTAQAAAQAAKQKAASVASRASESVSAGTQAVKEYSSISVNKCIGVGIWMIGAWLTSNTLSQLGVSDGVNVFMGILLQLAFTRAQAPIWRGRGLPKMGIAALTADVLINSAGAWPYSKKIGSTDIWTMVKEVAQDPNLQASVGTQFGIAFVAGAFTAAAAEYFMSLK